ncbi:uncharacterized protein LOC141701261 [Apium graveolens]|uniref:uncharacterized protein LOC141701261 n=1 Tax=Apium graveolens TaxID=4045 RepID=UPI003D7A39CC
MTLRQDALNYVKKCDACQLHAPVIHQLSEQLHISIPSWPFMKWGMDIVGKMPPAPGQRVFMLAMTDYSSKWIEAEAFKQVTSKKESGLKNCHGYYGQIEKLQRRLQTPYSLVYGTEAVLPTEIMVPTARYGLLTNDVNNAELSHDKDTVDEMREMAKIRVAAYQQRIANVYNKHVHIKNFHVGNMVLRKTF